MTIIINRQTAIDLMKRAVDEKGEEYVYPGSGSHSCKYVKDGAPSCLVGHALNYAGVGVEDLAAMDNGWVEEGSGDSGIMDIVDTGAESLPFRLTPAALDAFQAAQLRQDRGKAWGYALECAEAASKTARDEL